MATFPLAQRPAQSYKVGGVRFGDDRGEILHPGCDLIAPAGTEIFAVENGTVLYSSRAFFESGPHVLDENKKWVCKAGVTCLWVYDILIRHRGFLARYGEVRATAAPGITEGARVMEGQLIGWVGDQTVATMLHFEMYSNAHDTSYPTVKGNMHYNSFKPSKTFSRRKDLLDPTTYLDSCRLKSEPAPAPLVVHTGRYRNITIPQ